MKVETIKSPSQPLSFILKEGVRTDENVALHIQRSQLQFMLKYSNQCFLHLVKYSSLLLFSILCFFPHSFAHSMECKKH